jgi:hypothetical protein
MNRLLVLLVGVLTIAYCSIAFAQTTSDSGVSGRWKGTRSTTGRIGVTDYKVQSITFDLTESDGGLSGSSRCFAAKKANSDCPSPIGKLAGGSVQGSMLKMTVQSLPKQVECTYTGTIKESKIDGTYTCYAGGSLSSNGIWNIHRE